MLDQADERDLGRIGHAMKHRFAKEGGADHDSVEPAGKFAVGPRFHRVGEPELMQPQIALDYLAINPRILSCRAALDHVAETMVDLDFKDLLAQRTTEPVGDMKLVQRQNRAWIGREPFDRSVLHRHRENPHAITLEQKIGWDHGSLPR